MPQSTSRRPSEGKGSDYMKRARGLFLWLLLCIALMAVVSSFLISYLRDLHESSNSGVQICVQICGTNGIKLYDAKQKICECS